jgi:hypothetical protein
MGASERGGGRGARTHNTTPPSPRVRSTWLRAGAHLNAGAHLDAGAHLGAGAHLDACAHLGAHLDAQMRTCGRGSHDVRRDL